MIFHGHGIDDATITVTTGTAHASYPVANLNSRVFGKLLKTTGAALVLRIDFGAARSCDSIVLGNCNHDDDFTVAYGTADNGTDFETDILQEGSPFSAQSVETSIYHPFDVASKRYWRITFTSWTTSHYIGQIFLGTDYATPYNHEYNFNKGYSYGVQSNITRGGVDLRYENHAKKYIENNLKFRGFTDAQATAFLTYFNDSEKCSGVLKPFFFIPDGQTAYCHYAYFGNQELMFQNIVADFNEINLNIRQQI